MKRVINTCLFAICLFNKMDTAIGRELRGVVIDFEDERPVANALVSFEIIVGNSRINLGDIYSDSSGVFFIDVPDTISANIKIDINKENYFFKPIIIDSLPSRNAYDIGKIKIYYTSIKWPISDSIRALPPLREQAREPIPYPSPAYRTIKPPCMPRNIFAEQFDSHGGNWILFGTTQIYADLYLTYRYPDGSFENAIPIGMTGRNNPKLTVISDGVILVPGNIDNANWPKSESLVRLEELNKDSDKDGLPDRYELCYSLNPNDSDSDNDGINDLNDTFPTNPKVDIKNDTLEVLNCFFDTTYYWNVFGNNSFGEVIKALPDTEQKWVLLAAESVPGYVKEQPDWFHDFEKFLTFLSAEQLRAIYPYLKRLNEKPVNSEHSNKYLFVFPYVEALKDASSENIDRVRQEIMKTDFIYFLHPIKAQYDAEMWGLHPDVKGGMIIASGSINRNNSSKFTDLISLKVNRMSDAAALVSYDCLGFGEDYLLVKRDNKWIKVWKNLRWIE